MRAKLGYDPDMRSTHSRYAFAALDNLIDRYHIQSMRKREPMTFDEAVAIMKTFSINGRSLIDGCEVVKEKMRIEYDDLTDEDRLAFRIVCREMSKLFR
jgi:hypothetical protein